jgi:hypothetical protein
MNKKVTCIEEYQLSIITNKDKNRRVILHTFNVGDSFNKVYPPNKNIIHRDGFIQIEVGHLNLGINLSYEIVLVPESHFLTVVELRDYNINKIIE